MRIPTVIVAMAVLLLTVSAAGQTLIRRYIGLSAGDQFGSAVAFVGDLNLDGRDDYAVGGNRVNGTAGADSGQVAVYSGLDGSLLFAVEGPGASDNFGWAVAGGGDINGDSVPDVIVGAPGHDTPFADAGLVRAFSGVNGALLYSFTGAAAGAGLGGAVAHPGDVNNDGRDDILASAYAINANTGAVYVWSGLNGQLLYTSTGSTGLVRHGISLDGMGDVDNDGFDDWAVGHYSWAGPQPVRIYSGATGAPIRSMSGGLYFGFSLARLGDLSGDGVPDLVVGDPVFGSGGIPSARVFSGATGGQLFSILSGADDIWSGTWVARAGDLDADGRSEIIVGAPRCPFGGVDSGSARICSGLDGRWYHTLYGNAADAWFGGFAAGGGFVDNDTIPDFIVTSFKADSPVPGTGIDHGWVQVYSGASYPAGFANSVVLGASQPAFVLRAAPPPLLGTTIQVSSGLPAAGLLMFDFNLPVAWSAGGGHVGWLNPSTLAN